MLVRAVTVSLNRDGSPVSLKRNYIEMDKAFREYSDTQGRGIIIYGSAGTGVFNSLFYSGLHTPFLDRFMTAVTSLGIKDGFIVLGIILFVLNGQEKWGALCLSLAAGGLIGNVVPEKSCDAGSAPAGSMKVSGF